MKRILSVAALLVATTAIGGTEVALASVTNKSGSVTVRPMTLREFALTDGATNGATLKAAHRAYLEAARLRQSAAAVALLSKGGDVHSITTSAAGSVTITVR